MKFYRNTEIITKKEAIEWLGKERFDARLEEAKEMFLALTYNAASWDDGFGVGR